MSAETNPLSADAISVSASPVASASPLSGVRLTQAQDTSESQMGGNLRGAASISLDGSATLADNGDALAGEYARPRHLDAGQLATTAIWVVTARTTS